MANYNGVLSPNLFVEAQYSQKKFGFRGTGGTSTDIHDSPFMSLGLTGMPASRHYNAPYFASFDPEDRNNRQYAAALSYFLSTGSTGRHDLKVGGEHFTSWRTGGNSQSATGFVFFGDPVMAGGQPVIDRDGRLIPNFVPNLSRITNWLPVQGAQINLNTLVALRERPLAAERPRELQPRRALRAPHHRRHAGRIASTATSVVPRLGATFDVKGDGKWVLQATYAHYAGKAAETQFADNTNVGTPNQVTYTTTAPRARASTSRPASTSPTTGGQRQLPRRATCSWTTT